MGNTPKDQMSPDASPGAVTRKAGVRRVNNVPMYIVGGLLTIFLLVMVMVASDRAAKQKRPLETKVEKVSNTGMFAKALAGDRPDGIIKPRPAKVAAPPTAPGGGTAPSAPTSTPGSVVVVRPDNPDAPPTPPNSAGGQHQNSPNGQNGANSPNAGDEAANHLRAMKLQELDDAVKAKTSINPVAPRSSANAAAGPVPGYADNTPARLAAVRQQLATMNPDNPTEAYKSKLAALQSSGLVGGSGGAGSGDSGTQPGQTGNSGIAQFGPNGQADRWKLDSKIEAPHSPYELRAGFVIPATLISGINSELPGQIIGQVAQDVFDSATGNHLLIPQGSRLVGTYMSNVAYGQAWLLVAWQRIIFPDGKALDLGSMPGANSAGYAGFNDQVNNHFFRIFGSAILMSGVIAGVSLSQPQQNSNSVPTATSAMSQALGLELGQVTAQMIAKNLNIVPTLEIRPGYRFNIMVTKDLTFSKPYKDFDY